MPLYHSQSHSHSLTITCICCCDGIYRAQGLKISCSFSDSLSHCDYARQVRKTAEIVLVARAVMEAARHNTLPLKIMYRCAAHFTLRVQMMDQFWKYIEEVVNPPEEPPIDCEFKLSKFKQNVSGMVAAACLMSLPV